jgi:hypothetical protein
MKRSMVSSTIPLAEGMMQCAYFDACASLANAARHRGARSLTPPTRTGFPRSDGSSRCSTDA